MWLNAFLRPIRIVYTDVQDMDRLFGRHWTGLKKLERQRFVIHVAFGWFLCLFVVQHTISGLQYIGGSQAPIHCSDAPYQDHGPQTPVNTYSLARPLILDHMRTVQPVRIKNLSTIKWRHGMPPPLFAKALSVARIMHGQMFSFGQVSNVSRSETQKPQETWPANGPLLLYKQYPSIVCLKNGKEGPWACMVEPLPSEATTYDALANVTPLQLKCYSHFGIHYIDNQRTCVRSTQQLQLEDYQSMEKYIDQWDFPWWRHAQEQ